MSWEVFERIYSGHWFLSSYNAQLWVRAFPRLGGGNFLSQVVWIMDKGVCHNVFRSDEFEKSAQHISGQLANNGAWRTDIYKHIDVITKKYFKAGERLRKLPLATMTDDQLTREIERVIPLQRLHQGYSTLVNGLITDGRNHLSNRIHKELKNAMGSSHFETHWPLLSMPTRMSLRQQKEHAMAVLAKQVKTKPASLVARKLKYLHEKYCWLDYLYLGPPATFEQFQVELEEARQNPTALAIPHQLRQRKEQQRALMKKFHFGKRERFLVWLSQRVIWQKGYRKEMQHHGFYCYEPFFREVARRKKVQDWRTISFLFPWEMSNFIKNTAPPVAQLRKRKAFSAFIVTRVRDRFLLGSAARDFVEKLRIKKSQSDVKEIIGQCAYHGKARGTVKIIQVPTDMGRMNEGDILVSQATSPDLLPAMRKAAAIVTSTGGLICHAAITARELKIPCVVGTGNANIVLKNGDRVEVDATHGIVKKL